MRKGIVIAVVGVIIAGSIWYLEAQKPSRSGGEVSVVALDKTEKAWRFKPGKDITTPDGFINTSDMSIAGLVGKKVVLVDFWTYTCINCQRTIPYLNAWYEKYKNQGLEIIGIHTPEFEFEQKYENVKKAVEKFKIKYPVVLDNDYSTWDAYNNRYWPAKYLIDIDGFIVYHHFGEGAYEETERKIQEALAERANVLGVEERVSGDIAKPDADPGTRDRSPEIYFGAARNELLGNGKRFSVGLETLPPPENIAPEVLYLVGSWNIEREFAENAKTGAKIIFRYRGAKVFFVARASSSVLIKVFHDGKPLTEGAGKDVVNGAFMVSEDRLYELVDDEGGGEHTLEMIIESPGLQAYTFTFG